MGFEIIPRNKDIPYFERTNSGWYAIADYIVRTAPEIAGDGEGWFTNDHHGVSSEDARKLADILKTELDAGRVPDKVFYCINGFIPFLRSCDGFSIW